MSLTHLGRRSALPEAPDAAVLETVPNPHRGLLYLVRFTCPEFTSLCPVTGQPDFAHLVIDYAPGETIVESKSLKLFLGSYRNHCGFHEDVTVGKLIENAAKQFGTPVELVGFVRYAVGEGIDKGPTGDFADEVRQMAGN